MGAQERRILALSTISRPSAPHHAPHEFVSPTACVTLTRGALWQARCGLSARLVFGGHSQIPQTRRLTSAVSHRVTSTGSTPDPAHGLGTLGTVVRVLGYACAFSMFRRQSDSVFTRETLLGMSLRVGRVLWFGLMVLEHELDRRRQVLGGCGVCSGEECRIVDRQ